MKYARYMNDVVNFVRLLVSAFRKETALPEALRPYELACDYIDSERDLAFLERQHPEMREAILLLVGEDET